MRRSAALLFLAILPSVAQLKREPGSYENDRIAVASKVYADRESVKRILGTDFDGVVAVVEITATPRGGEPLDIEREDWTLFSNKDAQKAPAYHPSQLAGQGALVVSQRSDGGGAYSQNSPNAPVIGGIPGTGGYPRQLPGNGGVSGNGASAIENTSRVDKEQAAHPILGVLKSKELAYGKTEKPVTGLLYFSLEGKHKLKDLELWYRGPAGKFVISYKP